MPVHVIRGITDGDVRAGKRPHGGAARAQVRDRDERTELAGKALCRGGVLVHDGRQPEEEFVAVVMIGVLNQSVGSGWERSIALTRGNYGNSDDGETDALHRATPSWGLVQPPAGRESGTVAAACSTAVFEMQSKKGAEMATRQEVGYVCSKWINCCTCATV